MSTGESENGVMNGTKADRGNDLTGGAPTNNRFADDIA